MAWNDSGPAGIGRLTESIMARYFFDVLQESGCIRDEEGIELPNVDAMRQSVSRVILDLARDEIGNESQSWIQVMVRDDSDFALFTATLGYSTIWH
jgi:hypothetical protein